MTIVFLIVVRERRLRDAQEPLLQRFNVAEKPISHNLRLPLQFRTPSIHRYSLDTILNHALASSSALSCNATASSASGAIITGEPSTTDKLAWERRHHHSATIESSACQAFSKARSRLRISR